MAWKQRHVADVRAIDAIGKGSPGTHQPSVLVDEALEHAVRERGPETARILVSERRSLIKGSEFIPVEAVDGMRPNERHGVFL